MGCRWFFLFVPMQHLSAVLSPRTVDKSRPLSRILAFPHEYSTIRSLAPFNKCDPPRRWTRISAQCRSVGHIWKVGSSFVVARLKKWRRICRIQLTVVWFIAVLSVNGPAFTVVNSWRRLYRSINTSRSFSFQSITDEMGLSEIDSTTCIDYWCHVHSLNWHRIGVRESVAVFIVDIMCYLSMSCIWMVLA